MLKINATRPPKYRSPLYFIITMVITIFFAEVVVMFILSFIRVSSVQVEALVDSLLLIALVSPAI